MSSATLFKVNAFLSSGKREVAVWFISKDPIKRVLQEAKSLFRKPSEILEYFLTKAPFCSKWKEDKTKFTPLSVKLNLELVDRQESLEELWSVVMESAGSKTKVPLPATQSSPGGGKTAFLNLVASSLSNSSFKLLQNQIPILISFNQRYHWDPKYDSNADNGLWLRIICSFYFEKPKEIWDEIEPYFDNIKEYLTFRNTIKPILLTIGRECPNFKGIFLGVDKISKLKKEEQINEVLSSIGLKFD